jgi:SRSO17 transposase
MRIVYLDEPRQVLYYLMKRVFLSLALVLDTREGKASVGGARQWCGRLGKVENCQVAVFCVLTNGTHYTPVNKRLYLPQEWVADLARCNADGVPDEARVLISKSEHALQIVRDARAKGMRFAWVGADAGYGKEPAFLRKLNADGETFMVDVHSTQRIFINKPDATDPKKRVFPLDTWKFQPKEENQLLNF